MATRIRLQRHGKKRYPYYHIVVADSRVKRDGAKIERIGEYNPNTNPATINVDFDRALHWLQTGAQPSDTCRAILSYKGVLHKNHLLNGVKKGAFDEAEAINRFDAWLAEKEAKIMSTEESIAVKAAAEEKAILDAEKEISDKRAAVILAKSSPMAEEAPVEAAPAAEGDAAPAAEATSEPVAEEAPAAEAAPEPVAEEAPAAEVAPEPVAEEAPAAEVAPEPVAEEAPAAEAKAAETPDAKAEGKE
ncbi:MAG: small subunit ribosomal protein S16 [Urechidicola sp.]|jgi:small subunit ribosomal protein S16